MFYRKRYLAELRIQWYYLGMGSKKYVYHGTEVYKANADPKRHRRKRRGEVIFNNLSFHATPHYWIALAYTYTPTKHFLDGQKMHYNVGIDLYRNIKEVEVYGFDSLENSLEALYGNGGYILQFHQDDFFSMEGLGKLEVITQRPIKPLVIQRILQPVKKMKQEGVQFRFINLG